MVIAQGAKTLSSKQTAFDAEAAVIEAVLGWYETQDHRFRRMTIRLDSTSAIARADHSGAGPG